MRSMSRVAVIAAVGVGALLPMTAASAADSVTRTGACSATTTWSMRAAEAVGDTANLRLAVNSPRAGQPWSVALSRQGTRFFSTQVTSNAQGDFVLTHSAREVKNVDDVYTARAQNLRTGEVCSARVVLPD